MVPKDENVESLRSCIPGALFVSGLGDLRGVLGPHKNGPRRICLKEPVEETKGGTSFKIAVSLSVDVRRRTGATARSLKG
jgi:hypothetical protein